MDLSRTVNACVAVDPPREYEGLHVTMVEHRAYVYEGSFSQYVTVFDEHFNNTGVWDPAEWDDWLIPDWFEEAVRWVKEDQRLTSS